MVLKFLKSCHHVTEVKLVHSECVSLVSFPSPALSGHGCQGLVQLEALQSADGGVGAGAWQGGGRGKGAAREPHGCNPAGARACQGSLQPETAFPEDLQSGKRMMKNGKIQ